MMNGSARLDPRSRYVVVAPPQEFDVRVAHRVEQDLTRALTEVCPRLAVDLTGVAFIDASGLSVLLAAQRTAARLDGGDVVLVGPNARIGKLLRITGLDAVFLSVASVETLFDGAGPAGPH